MIPLQAVAIGLVVAVGTSVVLVRDPLRQVMVNGVYALVLAVLFFVFQAPDVALSILVVGLVAFPLVFLAAINRLRFEEREEEREG